LFFDKRAFVPEYKRIPQKILKEKWQKSFNFTNPTVAKINFLFLEMRESCKTLFLKKKPQILRYKTTKHGTRYPFYF